MSCPVITNLVISDGATLLVLINYELYEQGFQL